MEDTNLETRSDAFDISLIDEVRKRPELYHKSFTSLGYGDRRAKAWQDIAELLNTSASVCQTKWRYLRDKYARHLRSSNAGNGKPWNKLERMEFLKDYIVPRSKEKKPLSPSKVHMPNNFTRLINEVKSHPSLYDKNHATYFDRKNRDRAWEKISRVLKLSVTQCRQNWRNLRTRYVKRIQNKDYAFDKDLFDQMSFLRDFVSPGSRADLEAKYREQDLIDWDKVAIISNSPKKLENFDDGCHDHDSGEENEFSESEIDMEQVTMPINNGGEEAGKSPVYKTPLPWSDEKAKGIKTEDIYIEKRISCGDIVLLENTFCIKFRCSFCGKEMKKFPTFLKHTLLHHLSMTKEKLIALLQSCSESDYEKPDINWTPNDKDDVHYSEELEKSKIEEIESFTENEETGFLKVQETQSDCDALENNTNYNIEFISVAVAPQAMDNSRKQRQITMQSESRNYKSNENRIAEKSITYPVRYKCEYCDETFKTRNEFRSHENRHLKPHTCEICGASFAEIYNLRVHRKRHLGIKRFKCGICHKKFVTSTEVKLHLMTHTATKPFHCDQCNFSCIRAGLLRQHQRRHTNERPFICATCGKAFLTSCRLRNHEISHSDSKPHACDICDKRFSRRKALKEHKKLHTGVKRHVCNICSKGFAQFAGLYSHMKWHKRKDRVQNDDNVIEGSDSAEQENKEPARENFETIEMNDLVECFCTK